MCAETHLYYAGEKSPALTCRFPSLRNHRCRVPDLRAARGLDPVRDEGLQTPEVAVADALFFQVRHRVVQVLGAGTPMAASWPAHRQPAPAAADPCRSVTAGSSQ